jgi:hypothetical protein
MFLIAINRTDGNIITEVDINEISGNMSSKRIRTLFLIDTDEEKEIINFLLSNLQIPLDKSNFDNPIVTAYSNWKDTWRSREMDAPEWRKNTEMLSFARNNEYLESYIDKLRNIIFACRDADKEDVYDFLTRYGKR